MIDIESERIVTLRQAATIFPHPGREKPPHYVSVLRWCLDGLHGVRLESIKVGRKLHTSHEAINRFVNRSAEAKIQSVQARQLKKTSPKLRSVSRREKDIAKAQKELEAGGA